MRSNKKAYSTPAITVYGDVEKITQKGGSTATDVPAGTPVTDGISSVAGDPS